MNEAALPVIAVVPAVLGEPDLGLRALRICSRGSAGAGRDMGVPSRSYYPALPPAIYDWTGVYVGGHLGGGILTDSVSQKP